MVRNYLAAALRNLIRHRVYALISIGSLALGFAAALLIALFVRDEFSYDKFLPGHERTFAVYTHFYAAGGIESEWQTIGALAAEFLKSDFSSVEETTRLVRRTEQSFRRDDREYLDTMYWADPSVFKVLPLPAIAGDPSTALQQPDTVVLTRRMAEKYFGTDNPIGQTIELNHKYSLRVGAVLADLPYSTSLDTEIFVSAKSSASPLMLSEPQLRLVEAFTFLRLKPGSSIEGLRAAAHDFSMRRLQDVAGGVSRRYEPNFVALSAVHLTRLPQNYLAEPMTPAGSVPAIKALIAVAAVIVGVALTNFVNLMTARASRRAIEVGIRKLSGAERLHLIIQFVGEAALYVIAGLSLAVALAGASLPAMNAYLGRSISFSFLHNGAAVAVVLLAGAASAVLGGFYPALVLSSFRPGVALTASRSGRSGAVGRVRQFLVLLQFAILIGLVASSGVIYRQVRYAENEGLRLNKDQIILINSGCHNGFRQAVEQVQGVQFATCSGGAPLRHIGTVRVKLLNGSDDLRIAIDPVDFDFFKLFGVHAVAGRLFSREFGKDAMAGPGEGMQSNVIINESLAAQLGFSPEAAVGQTITFHRFNFESRQFQYVPGEVIGVVPDFPTGSVAAAVMPTAFFVDPREFALIAVKLTGSQLPETLNAVRALWTQYSASGQPDNRPTPFYFAFFDQKVQALYRDISRESELLGILSAVAMLIASAGLFGLAGFTAERRTREIGVRKALGARNRDILLLLLWEFAKPVVVANAIAWPAVYLLMQRWLEGFAYHTAFSPWILVLASVAALIIAVLTVLVHVLSVSRTQPAAALRYE
jgi:putative ABC transport system permease protein